MWIGKIRLQNVQSAILSRPRCIKFISFSNKFYLQQQRYDLTRHVGISFIDIYLYINQIKLMRLDK